MSDTSTPGGAPEQKQMMSAMFASLVMQNTNMALVFLGHAPNPQTGETSQNLEHAQYFIDQLEMLAVKTKGNLDRTEEMMLKQSLTSLRLAFVEAVSKERATPSTDEQETASAELPPEGEPAGEAAPIAPPTGEGEAAESAKAAEAESKKKFTKKY